MMKTEWEVPSDAITDDVKYLTVLRLGFLLFTAGYVLHYFKLFLSF